MSRLEESVDESYDRNNRQQSRTINALPTESHDVVRRSNRRRAVAQRAPDEPPLPLAKPVPLGAHYNKLYNRHMNRRMQQEEQEDSDDGEACSEDYVSALRADPDDYVATLQSASGSRKRTRQQYDTENRSECFLCAWGNRFHDGIKAEHVRRLNDMMDGHGHMSNLELAQQMHLYFIKYVYQRERGMAILTVEVALEHIEGLHSHSAQIYLGEQLNTYKRLHFCLENEIYREDGSRDDRTLDRMLKVAERLDKLYMMDPAKMVYSMGKTKEDTRALGRATRIMTMTKQVEEREKRQQRVVWQQQVVEEFSV